MYLSGGENFEKDEVFNLKLKHERHDSVLLDIPTDTKISTIGYNRSRLKVNVPRAQISDNSSRKVTYKKVAQCLTPPKASIKPKDSGIVYPCVNNYKFPDNLLEYFKTPTFYEQKACKPKSRLHLLLGSAYAKSSREYSQTNLLLIKSIEHTLVSSSTLTGIKNSLNTLETSDISSRKQPVQMHYLSKNKTEYKLKTNNLRFPTERDFEYQNHRIKHPGRGILLGLSNKERNDNKESIRSVRAPLLIQSFSKHSFYSP